MSNFLNFSGNSGVTFKSFTASGGTTYTLDKPSSTNSVMVSVGGVMQKPSTDYSVSGTTLTTTSTVTSGIVIDTWIIHDAGNAPVIEDNSIVTAKIANSQVTADKLDTNAVTNVKVADDAIGVAELSATGTASSSTYLRGDNSWAAAGGGSWTHLSTTSSFWDGSAGTDPIEYTGLTAGKVYKFILEDIELSATGKVVHAIFGYGSTTWYTSGTDHYYSQVGRDSGGNNLDASSGTLNFIPIAGSGQTLHGGTRNACHAGIMYMELILRTGTGNHTQAYPTIHYHGGLFTSSGNSAVITGAGMSDGSTWDSNPCTAIKFDTEDSTKFVDGRILQYILAD